MRQRSWMARPPEQETPICWALASKVVGLWISMHSACSISSWITIMSLNEETKTEKENSQGTANYN
jgi:hypothetical protein